MPHLTSELGDSFAEIDALHEVLEEALATVRTHAAAAEELSGTQANAAALTADNAALREREQARAAELEAKDKEIVALRAELAALKKPTRGSRPRQRPESRPLPPCFGTTLIEGLGPQQRVDDRSSLWGSVGPLVLAG